MKKINMDSLVTVLAAVEKDGFQNQFEVTDNGLKSLNSGKEFTPEEVHIVHFYRFEGESNQDDSSILYAIETSDNEKGTLVDGYGTTADGKTAAFIQKVTDIHK
jgi:hypothetical protein